MGVTVAVGAVALAGGVYAAEEQKKAGRKQARAQEKANEIEARRSQIANQRERARAAAATQFSMAQNIASQSYFGGSTSSMQGANASLQSQLSSAIGYQNTQLAANALRSDVLQMGQDQYNKHMGRAAWGQLASQTAGTVSGFTGR